MNAPGAGVKIIWTPVFEILWPERRAVRLFVSVSWNTSPEPKFRPVMDVLPVQPMGGVLWSLMYVTEGVK